MEQIDFVLLIEVDYANPNGDGRPENGNRPRQGFMSGYGEISDVCIKRKIRNRLQAMGESIFIQPRYNQTDEYQSLNDRFLGNIDITDCPAAICENACEKWLDVRLFGHTVTYTKSPIGIRGAVTIRPAISISPIDIEGRVTTRCTNSMNPKKSVKDASGYILASDTLFERFYVLHGMYKLCGSINMQLCQKNGVSLEDIEKLKYALKTLYLNDESSNRPNGSIYIYRMFWFEQKEQLRCSAAKVQRSVKVTPLVEIPRSEEDYRVEVTPLDGVDLEEVDPL